MKPYRILLFSLFLVNLALSLGLVSGHDRTLDPQASRAPVLEQIAVRDAVKHLASKDALFVDARPLGAYEKAHPITAVSLPMGQQPSPELLERLRRTPKIIVYCDGPGCRAAEKVATSLVLMKFENVVVMGGGMSAWMDLGMPMSGRSD